MGLERFIGMLVEGVSGEGSPPPDIFRSTGSGITKLVAGLLYSKLVAGVCDQGSF